MPLKIAVRKCPQAVLLPVDAPLYEAASEQVMATLRGLDGAVVEVLGWDEAFVGIDTDDPEAFARRIQAEVLAATDLHCSVGIGDTKIRAKIATDFGKPQGVFRLTRDNWFEVMGDRPTGALWGVGKRISARLAGLGISTVRDLAAAEPERLAAEFGPAMGPYYGRLGRGVSSARVDDTPYIPRAHGRETTYQQNLTGAEEIAQAIASLAEQVARTSRRRAGPACACTSRCGSRRSSPSPAAASSPEPTFDAALIGDTALDLLRAIADERPIRLLGVRAEMVAARGWLRRPGPPRRPGPARGGLSRCRAAGRPATRGQRSRC